MHKKIRKDKIKSLNIFKIRSVTADGYIQHHNTFIHVMNSSLQTEKSRRINMAFVKSKFNHYYEHLPNKACQLFLFDVRGQNINKQNLISMEKELIRVIDNQYFKIQFKFKFK